jgi:hypothetical protein
MFNEEILSNFELSKEIIIKSNKDHNLNEKDDEFFSNGYKKCSDFSGCFSFITEKEKRSIIW